MLRRERRGSGPGRFARLFVARHRRLIAATCVAVAVAAAVRALAPPPAPTQVVLVAARDLPAGRTLAGRDLRAARWPAGTVPEGVLTAAEGLALASPLRAGEPVTDVRVVGPGLLAGRPARTVAAAVRVADPAAARLVRAGDRVDVFAASGDVGGYTLGHDPGAGPGPEAPGQRSGTGAGSADDAEAGPDGGEPRGGGADQGGGAAPEPESEWEAAGQAGSSAGGGTPAADLVAADVLVLAAPGAGPAEGSGGGSAGGSGGGGFGGLTGPLAPSDDGSGAGLLVLGVDRATAARLADAQGSRPLSIAIRGQS